MRDSPTNPSQKMLPGRSATGGSGSATPATVPPRQLAELPHDELEALAEEFGLDPTRFKSNQHLVAAIHDRRQMIAELDRDALLDVIKWGRRPVPLNAGKEHLAQEIARIRSMRFAGLSQRGLAVLARMRGIHLRGDETVPVLIKKLRKQEGLFARFNRKRRAWIGSVVSNWLGEPEDAEDYQFLPPQQGQAPGPGAATSSSQRSASLKEEIEDAGLIGGITGRLRKTADVFVNQKLDEIEARIDRKLDEIDRRLAEWRDKEIANRLLILKFTLWASVIVGLISLILLYIRVYWIN